MSKLLNNSKGFTLIESTVAIAILMVGIWTVVQSFPIAIRIIGDSQNLTVASNLTVAQIEEIGSLDYDLIGTGTIETKQPVSSDPNSYLNNYQRQTVVELIDSNFNTSATDIGLKKITVTVFWTSPIGLVEKSTNSITVIANF